MPRVLTRVCFEVEGVVLTKNSRYSAAGYSSQIQFMRPGLPAFAILLISCLPVWAAEPDFFDPEVLRHGASAPPAEKPEWLAARLLERAPGPGDAAERLLAMEQAGELDKENAAAALAEIEGYRQLDAYHRARFISDSLWHGWSVSRYNEFWLDQAAHMLQHDQLRQAERSLRHLRKPWTEVHGARRYSLWGRLYLQQKNYADAVIALDRQVTVSGDGLFDHYNFGLALLETGNRGRGLALLDDIGLFPAETPDHHALRDRVNLSMGWHWLASDQGGTAREYFRRVRLAGPYSNLALLGLGWAELAADGKPQHARFKRRVLCEKAEVPPDAFMRLLGDRYAACRPGEKSGVFDITHDFAFDTAAHGAGRYLEALRPWQVLARRSAHDPAVQEALLAAGFAQQKREAQADAGQAYRLAVERYETESRRLDALQAALQAEDPVAVVKRQALPGEFAALRGSRQYMQALDELDAVQQSAQMLDALEGRLARLATDRQPERQDELRTRLRQLRLASMDLHDGPTRNLRQWLLDDVRERRARLDQYHARARLALARIYDQSRSP
jgi:hypothetical protein